MNEFTSKQLDLKRLNRRSVKKLQAIANHYKEENLLHTLNLMIDGLFRSLKLEIKED